MYTRYFFKLLVLILSFYSISSYAYFDPLKCGMFIQKKENVFGLNVKTESMSCAWSVLKNGGGERLYKICIKKKLKEKITSDLNESEIINKIWDIVKKSCT